MRVESGIIAANARLVLTSTLIKLSITAAYERSTIAGDKMAREEEYVFHFQRFDFRVTDEVALHASAELLRRKKAARQGYGLPQMVETNADAIDVHIAVTGFDAVGLIPGVRFVSRSSRTMSYDFEEEEFEESLDDPFLWGTDEDE